MVLKFVLCMLRDYVYLETEESEPNPRSPLFSTHTVTCPSVPLEGQFSPPVLLPLSPSSQEIVVSSDSYSDDVVVGMGFLVNGLSYFTDT